MSHKAVKPANMPWLLPYLIVNDAKASVEFYQNAFGFSLREEPMKDEQGQITHAELQYQDMVVMIGAEGAYGGTTKTPAHSGVESPVTLYIYCDDVDKLCTRAKEVGAQIVSEPEDTFWGDRMCRIKDLDSHNWSFGTKIKDFELSKMSG